MKSHITSMLMSFSFLAASVTVTAAQEVQPSSNTVVVGSGNDLRCRLEKGLRITKPGAPITAKLVQPVYAGTTLAIPEGSTIKGHLSSVSTAPFKKRARRLLGGDFTPPRTANVTFDQVILPDGTAVEIHTDTTVGTREVCLITPNISIKEQSSMQPCSTLFEHKRPSNPRRFIPRSAIPISTFVS